MRRNSRRLLALLLAVLSAALLCAAFYLFRETPAPPAETALPTPVADPSAPADDPVPQGTPELVEPSPLPEEDEGLPTGVWAITPARRRYESASLTLTIPKLDLTRPIYDGTDADTLRKGVGLYEYAQLPGEEKGNVSLAGHRNGLDKNGRVTDHAPFYYVDELEEGDYLYLSDGAHIYRYVYDWTEVVEPDDWGPIATAGESCLTLTSCTPIGISDHRIVVRAVLDEIFDDTGDFDYLASREDMPS